MSVNDDGYTTTGPDDTEGPADGGADGVLARRTVARTVVPVHSAVARWRCR
jgi:hypothetical protein